MLRFRIDNMTCEGCVRGVTRAIGKAAPAATTTVDLATRTLTVDGDADPGRVASALQAAGYAAAPLGAEAA